MLVGVVQAEGVHVGASVAGVHQEVAEDSEEAEVVVVAAEVSAGVAEVSVEVIVVVVEEVAVSAVVVATVGIEDHEEYIVYSLSPFDHPLRRHIQKICSGGIIPQSEVSET